MIARIGALLLLCPLIGNVAAAADEAPPQVTVEGTGEVKVAPDEVVFEIAIEALDKDVAKSRESCESRFKKLIAAAKQQGLTDKDIQADRISIEPQSQYQRQTEQYEFVGYRTRYALALTLRDVSKYEALLTDILQTPIDRLNTEWRSSKHREYSAEARRLAVLAAKEKAAALAEALGQQIGSAYNVTERYAPQYGRYQEMARLASSATGETELTAHPGELTITADMSVSFMLLSKAFSAPAEAK